MPNPHIKWTDSQRKKLATAVSRFNGKLTREQRKNPKLAIYLPERMSTEDLRKTITTAKDLERLVKSVDRVFKPHALEPVATEQGILTTNWEIEDIRLKVNRINRQRQKELDQLPEVPSQKGIMGAIKRNKLKPKKFNPNEIKGKDWNAFVRSVERQARDSYVDQRDEQYKQNYIRAIQNELGAYGLEVYELLSQTPARVVANGWLNNPLLDIDFVYGPEQASAKAEALLAEWTDYIESYSEEASDM